MNNEKNQTTEGIQVHDIIGITSHQRTKDNGEKRGYSWNEKTILGVVVARRENHLTIKTPNSDEEEYDAADESEDYYHTIESVSEILYKDAMQKEVKKLLKQKDDVEEKIVALTVWVMDFHDSITLLKKLKTYLFGSKK